MHAFSLETLCPGVQRGECSCGWISRISNDALMYCDDWYSPDLIRRDWEQHRQSRAGDIRYLDITRDVAGGPGARV